MPRGRGLSLCLAASVALVAAPVAAQTVRDKVKDHVEKNVDDRDDRGGKRQRRKRRGTANEGSDRRRRSRSRSSEGAGRQGPVDTAGPEYTLNLDDPELSDPGGPKLPLRLFPRVARYVSLDLKVDGAYRGWLPQQYDAADVDIASFYTWSVAVKGKLFRRLAIHRAYYESNGLSAPRTRNAAVAARVGKHTPKAAKALAYLGFPFWKRWQPIVRYEARAFNTTATPNIPVCIVDRQTSGDSMDCPLTTDRLRMISTFETFVAGVRYSSQQESRSFFATPKGKLPPIYAGVGLMQYRKPYQVTVDGDTLDEFLFDGRFRGAGLAVGTNVGGGARRLFAQLDLQVGLGEVSLTDDLTLNEVAPDGYVLGYVQGSLRGGYRVVLVDGPPTVYFTPAISAGGASFHFITTRAEEGQSSDAPNVNWDFLWSARAALEVAL